MKIRINTDSCKNAMGTVFLLATAFFICSTFISMRSVFADPIAQTNVNVQQSSRQSPRTNTRTSGRTISRSTVSRSNVTGSAGDKTSASRDVTKRSVASRPVAEKRANNVSSRNIVSRNQKHGSILGHSSDIC